MLREYVKWHSPSLHRDMELLVFGHAGFPLLVFPTSYGRFFEYEERGMIDTLRSKIDRGELQVCCVDSVDNESWYNKHAPPADRLHRQNAYDAYLALEVVPFLQNKSSWPQISTTGCSFGGYHAINFALRHPGIVTYAVSMSGAFNIPQRFLEGFHNVDSYLHSPLEYLINVHDGHLLGQMQHNYYVLATGEHDPLFDQNVRLAHALGTQHIPHKLDVWQGFGHDWPWWQSMAAKFFLE